jgi:hypothetical protein
MSFPVGAQSLIKKPEVFSGVDKTERLGKTEGVEGHGKT